MNSREKGDEFEQKVAKLLNMRQTANSGAMHDDADLRPRNGKPVIAEAKVRNTETSVKSRTHMDICKLENQADKLGKDWFYVIRDLSQRELIICPLNFFAEATEGYFSE
jgi:hypothetical protein|tara:strand:- start:524 stop:850 length:327 start_codon:yes stop_codon:yes gene_type:complete